MQKHYVRILDPQLSLDSGEITAIPSKTAILPVFQGESASRGLPTTSAQLPALPPNGCNFGAHFHTQTKQGRYLPVSTKQQRDNARALVNSRRQLGWFRPPRNCQLCRKCGRKLYGHHRDYTKPAEVIWLCGGCHQRVHIDPRLVENHPVFHCIDYRGNPKAFEAEIVHLLVWDLPKDDSSASSLYPSPPFDSDSRRLGAETRPYGSGTKSEAGDRPVSSRRDVEPSENPDRSPGTQPGQNRPVAVASPPFDSEGGIQ